MDKGKHTTPEIKPKGYSALMVGSHDRVMKKLEDKYRRVGIRLSWFWTLDGHRDGQSDIPIGCNLVVILRDSCTHNQRDMAILLAKEAKVRFIEVSSKFAVAKKELVDRGVITGKVLAFNVEAEAEKALKRRPELSDDEVVDQMWDSADLQEGVIYIAEPGHYAKIEGVRDWLKSKWKKQNRRGQRQVKNMVREWAKRALAAAIKERGAKPTEAEWPAFRAGIVDQSETVFGFKISTRVLGDLKKGFVARDTKTEDTVGNYIFKINPKYRRTVTPKGVGPALLKGLKWACSMDEEFCWQLRQVLVSGSPSSEFSRLSELDKFAGSPLQFTVATLALVPDAPKKSYRKLYQSVLGRQLQTYYVPAVRDLVRTGQVAKYFSWLQRRFPSHMPEDTLRILDAGPEVQPAPRAKTPEPLGTTSGGTPMKAVYSGELAGTPTNESALTTSDAMVMIEMAAEEASKKTTEGFVAAITSALEDATAGAESGIRDMKEALAPFSKLSTKIDDMEARLESLEGQMKLIKEALVDRVGGDIRSLVAANLATRRAVEDLHERLAGLSAPGAGTSPQMLSQLLEAQLQLVAKSGSAFSIPTDRPVKIEIGNLDDSRNGSRRRRKMGDEQ